VEPELALLEIDRIVEEELVAWRRACLAAVATPEVAAEPYRSGFEPGTFVRVKSTGLRGVRLA
jgi:hypothetical protein